jgi:hypothetical protein
MATAISPFFRDPSFDPFLFAAIGEERNGMLLSVVSALARLDLDPWFEAASLSRLSAPAATDRLTSLLSPSPGSMMKAPAHATIARLVGLLPKPAEKESWSPPAVVTRSKMSWPMAAYFILAFVIMCAAQFAERRDPPASTGGGASTAAGVSKPGAAKGHGD